MELRQKSREAAELDESLRQLQTQSLTMGPSKGSQQQLPACKCNVEREKFEAKIGELESRLKTLAEEKNNAVLIGIFFISSFNDNYLHTKHSQHSHKQLATFLERCLGREMPRDGTVGAATFGRAEVQRGIQTSSHGITVF